jgi:hypothetical protein
MSPLFRKSEKKVAQQAAVQAEIERLKGLRLDDLAVALMPGLGPDGPTQGQSLRMQQLCDYLVRDFPGGGRLQPLQLMPRVRAALERLERAELVYSISLQRLPTWRITRLGDTVLAEGTIEQHITNGG